MNSTWKFLKIKFLNSNPENLSAFWFLKMLFSFTSLNPMFTSSIQMKKPEAKITVTFLTWIFHCTDLPPLKKMGWKITISPIFSPKHQSLIQYSLLSIFSKNRFYFVSQFHSHSFSNTLYAYKLYLSTRVLKTHFLYIWLPLYRTIIPSHYRSITPVIKTIKKEGKKSENNRRSYNNNFVFPHSNAYFGLIMH